jgi:CheY-like chemotaxis protein
VKRPQKNEVRNATTPSNASGPLVYVVDDEPMLLELATIVLGPLGYKVRTFRDPEQVLEAFTSGQPQPALVITDYSMHNLNGMDLVVQCKKLRPGQKVILVSGTVGQEVFVNSPVKPDRFLAKPYQAKQLREVVSELVPWQAQSPAKGQRSIAESGRDGGFSQKASA